MIPATLHSEEAEQGALSSMLLRPSLVPETISALAVEDFTCDPYRRFFHAIKTAFTGGHSIDLVSVLTSLRESGNLKTDDPGHLAKLTSLAIIPGLDHCRTVARLSRSRQFMQEIDKAKASIVAGHNLETVIDQFAPAIQKGSSRSAKARPLSETIDGELSQVLERANNGGRLPGLSTGFADIDRITGGLTATNLIILAARPSMGKTTLALNVAEFVARSGVPVCFFSMEMSRSELTEKLFARAASVPLQRVRDGSFSYQERQKIEAAANGLKSTPLFLHDQPGLSIHQLTATAKSIQMRHGLGLIIVDYLGLMRAEGKTREQEVSALSRGLKCLAMDLKIPVIALSQLNRNLEARSEKRPSLADLRDSGSIEQDANIVAFIYRDEIYNTSQNNPHRGIAEVIVAKNRSGPTGAVKLGTSRLSYSELTTLQKR